jgi:hypothetical protein
MVLFKTLVKEKEKEIKVREKKVREIKVRKVIKEVIREQENIDDKSPFVY